LECLPSFGQLWVGIASGALVYCNCCSIGDGHAIATDFDDYAPHNLGSRGQARLNELRAVWHLINTKFDESKSEL